MKQTTYIIADNQKLAFWTGNRWVYDRAKAKTFEDVELARVYGQKHVTGDWWIVNQVEGGTV